jgi:hypothetical protein
LGERYLLIDSYAKEIPLIINQIKSQHSLNSETILKPYSVPLKLVDILLRKEVWLLQVQVASSSFFQIVLDDKKNSIFDIITKYLSFLLLGTKDSFRGKDWRCDPHPVVSHDMKWIAYNSFSSRKNKRQLRLANIASVSSISDYFNHSNVIHF